MQSILPAVILICVVDSFLSHLSLYLYLSALLGPQMRWKKLWMVFPILVLVATGTNLAQLFAVEYIYIAYFLSSIVIYLVNLLIVWLMWERRLSRASICLTIAAILQVGTVTMLFTFLGEMGTDRSDLVQYYSHMFIGYPGLTLLFRFLLNKAHLPQRIRVLMDRTKKPVRMAFCVLGLETLCEIFFLLKNTMQTYFFRTYFIGALMLMTGILFVLVYFSLKAESEARLQAQEALLSQQALYVQNLERIQQEMRDFRHDYKNLMSGLYVSAREGDLAPVQEMLKNMTGYFDEKVGEDIRRTTQLGNIRILELKGLVLTKLMEMQEQGIFCNLEVLYPVNRIDMEIPDVVRCLGILLDNAAEAAKETKKPEVDLMISSLESGVTIVVKNMVEEPPNLNRIWERGYSTKGEDRGLGLSIYRQVTGKYANVYQSASYQEPVFFQEWYVENRRGR